MPSEIEAESGGAIDTVGGQWDEAIANINRLRRMDENLGGTQFAAQINALSETP